MAMVMPPRPDIPEPVGETAPAMMGGDQPGKSVQGEVLVSLAMTLLEKAIPAFVDHEDKTAATQAHLTLLKRFGEVEGDIQAAALKFMQSQVNPTQRPPMGAMDQGGQIKNQLTGLGVNPPQAVEGAPAGGV